MTNELELYQQKDVNEQRNTHIQEDAHGVVDLHVQNGQLAEQVQHLLLLSRYRAELLAALSNQLISPINSIIMLAELQLHVAEEPGTQEDQLRMVRMIHASGLRLLELSQEIDELSRLEMGEQAVQCEEVNISEFPQILLYKMESLYKTRHCEIKLSLDEDLPAIFYSDGHLMERIATNLLAAVTQQAPGGEVELRLQHREGRVIPAQHNGKAYPEWLELSVTYSLPSERFVLPQAAEEPLYSNELKLLICAELARILEGFLISA